MKSSQPIIVIHHSADYDGIFCREIARKFFGDKARYIGWDYGDAKIFIPDDTEKVYVLDLSPDCIDGWGWPLTAPLIAEDRFVWIDHHKSAIDKFAKELPGYRIDGVAACRLAWQWFFSERGPMNPNLQEPDYALPTDVQFKNREVSEPLAVRLAGEYDVWDHRDNEADVAFQFGLDAQETINWPHLLREDNSGDTSVGGIVFDGRAAMRCYAKRDADVMRTRSFLAYWEGLKFLALNTARCNSKTFAERDDEETGHDALMAFYWNGKEWSVSLYHAAHRKDLDLSVIAAKHGGGGHRGACGFRAKSGDFIPTACS